MQRPFGRTLILATGFFLFFVFAAELVTRTDAFQSQITRPTWGSRHTQFEIQLDRLNQIIDSDGIPDCIFLGNSMVMRGFDPIAFANSYRAQTGQDIRCFNFGVEGIPAVAAAALARILVMDYQPRLLIYGTDARDYAVQADDEDSIVLLETPWVRYRLGEFNVVGWLFDVSHLLRYRKSLLTLMRFDYERSLRNWGGGNELSRHGFDFNTEVSELANTPPDPDSELFQVQYYYRMLSDYEMLPENILALEEIASLVDHETEVLVVEMPVPATYLYFFSDNGEGYQSFLNKVGNIANEYDVTFWITTRENLIPADGWVDYSHMNKNGARVFSEWLGKQVADGITTGELDLKKATRNAGTIGQ